MLMIFAGFLYATDVLHSIHTQLKQNDTEKCVHYNAEILTWKKWEWGEHKGRMPCFMYDRNRDIKSDNYQNLLSLLPHVCVWSGGGENTDCYAEKNQMQFYWFQVPWVLVWHRLGALDVVASPTAASIFPNPCVGITEGRIAYDVVWKQEHGFQVAQSGLEEEFFNMRLKTGHALSQWLNILMTLHPKTLITS